MSAAIDCDGLTLALALLHRESRNDGRLIERCPTAVVLPHMRMDAERLARVEFALIMSGCRVFSDTAPTSEMHLHPIAGAGAETSFFRKATFFNTHRIDEFH
jgi:hypothetical protein